MTPQDQNALIAKHMAQDPEWAKWATRQGLRTFVTVDERSGQEIGRWSEVCDSPRDFAAPENTLKLVEWASKQEWWDTAKHLPGYTQPSLSPQDKVCDALMDLADPDGPDAAECALRVRGIIADRLKELDGDAR